MMITSSNSEQVKPILVNNVNETKPKSNSLKLSTNHLSTETSHQPNSPQPVWNMDDFEINQPIGKQTKPTFAYTRFLILYIGYGSSATVYSAIHKSHSKKVAIKVIDLDKFERNQIDELRVK
jgi:hypothetical protein